MGGEIGLMLGASLLTFFEFVDLFAFLGYHQLLRLNKQASVSDGDVVDDGSVESAGNAEATE